METERLLDSFLESKKAGLDALRRGDNPRARGLLLEAAEYLFQLSGKTQGSLRAKRARNARDLFQLACSIPKAGKSSARAGARAAGKGGGSARGPGGSKVALDTTDDEDGAHDFRIRERPSVRFDDVAGLEDVKEQFRLKLIYPFLHPDRAEKFRIPRGGGILLYGPPGTGKTLLAKAVAGEIDADFFTVKPSEIMSKWVGEAEKNIEALFEIAHSCPLSVVFVDEIDALAPKRSENRSSVMARVVPQILAEMEGFASDEANSMLFIGATNEPWSLDSAILRPGRFDEKIYIGLPDPPAVRKILELNLRARPLAEDVDLDALTEKLAGYSGADIRAVCERSASRAFLRAVREEEDIPISQEDLLNAAASVSPSVSPKELKRYERFGRSAT